MSDLISRQAAIEALHMHLMYRMGTDSNKKRLDDRINGLPSAQETHEERTETHACDLISRQEAIDEIGEWIKAFLENGHKESAADARLIQDGIIQLSSAQPEKGYTKEELKAFLRALSVRLLSLRSAQHWIYDDKTAEELKFLSHLYKKVEADMKGKA